MKKITFLLVFIFCSLAVNKLLAQGAVPDDVEYQALKDLYNSTNGVGWGRKTNWPTTWPTTVSSAQFGTWYGVTVTNGDVTAIDFYSNNLSGVIPASIGNLTKLISLKLTYNRISGSIPTQLGNLTNLTQLDLSYNFLLNGAIPSELGNLTNLTILGLTSNKLNGAIPASLGNLTKLTSLSVSSNSLTGSIPPSLGNLTKLISLNLGGNQLAGSIPSELGNLTELTYLSLGGNWLAGSIPPELGKLTNLQTLYLSINQLTGNIPTELGKLNQLTLFGLSNNKLTGSIPASLGGFINLLKLQLNNNQLSGAIPLELGNLKSLQLLDVSNNQLSGDLNQAFFNSLSKVQTVNFLTNKLTGAFPESVYNCGELTSLDLSNNQFTSLPNGLLQLPKLTSVFAYNNELRVIPNFGNQINKANLSVSLSNNRLDFSSLEPLFNQGFGSNYNLTEQKNINDVQSIKLAPPAGFTIPARNPGRNSTIVWERRSRQGNWSIVNSLNEDPTQKTFVRKSYSLSDEGIYRWSMTNTLVTGMVIKSDEIAVYAQDLVPDDVEFQVLKDFYNSTNGASWRWKTNWPTTWPATATSAEFGTWWGIEVANGDITMIALLSNNLSGSIPASINNLKKLTTLWLTGNQLTSIPANLDNLTSLSFVSLSNNKFNSIPPSLGSLSALKSLELGRNELTGTIPTELNKLTNLTSLDLYQNLLSGPIPAFLGSLSSLQGLDLRQNQFTGTIPTSLSNLKNLTYLFLSGNQLSGAIPPELGNLTNLYGLYLDNNQLSGDIPPSIGNLKKLGGLHLNNNQFTGAFPESVSNCNQLAELRLHNNQITSLPNALLPMSMLRELNADNNELKTIPDFAMQANKTALALTLTNNKLDFSSLEPLVNKGISSLAVSPQKSINDVQSAITADATGFIIPARNLGLNSTITWEKQQTDASWASVNSRNEDPTQKIFWRKTYSATDGGVYRWKMTNTLFPGLVSYSDLITVKAPQSLADAVEYQALKDLYTATNGAGWTTKTNWPTTWPATATSAQFGTWFGVTVTNGDITSINLNNNNLSGSIPVSLGNLTKLNNLILSNNKLSGAIPPQLGNLNLTKLQNLHLNNNQLTGAVPESLSNCVQLVQLRLNNNQFTSLPNALLPLTMLTELNADNNELKTIPDFATQANKTKLTLTLSNNRFDFSSLEPLANKGISALVVGPQKTVNDVKGAITLTVTGFTIPARNLGLNSTITWEKQQLNTSWASVSSLNEDATQKTFLRKTYSADDAGMYRWKMTNTLFPSLVLYSDPITVNTLQNFDLVPDAVEYQALKDLYTATNGTGWYNKINWPTSWPATATSAQFGTWFGVTVTNGDITSIIFSNNNLSGPIPVTISNLTKLTILTLYGNKLSGAIPPQLGNLTNLTILNLSGNQLNDAIPSQLGNLTNLIILSLSINQLSGAIPSQLGNLTKLQTLWLGNNQLNSSIPSQLGTLTNLASLYLDQNQLSGAIPSELGNLTSLAALDLSKNKLSDAIPTSIGNLTKLEVLKLSGNLLSGVIPTQLGNLTNLTFLYLDQNQLSGALPATMGNLTNLLSLQLAKNQFSSLPNVLLSLSKLNSLYVSDNELKAIPNFATKANKAAFTLDLSNNRLSFSVLLPLINQGISSLLINPQRGISDVANISMLPPAGFTIKAQAPEANSTITWEKRQQINLQDNWVSASQRNEDLTQKTFLRKAYSPLDEGEYRWKMTNSAVTGVSIYSNVIKVSSQENFVPDATEYQVLKDLFTSTNGASWTTKTNWPTAWPATATSAQFGTWFGVTVKNGDVTELKFPNNNLEGALPANLTSLTKLMTLDMSSNKLIGSIPTANIYLTNLSLGYNKFAGSVPSQVEKLVNLVTLNIAGNQLTGTIPISLGKLTNLTTLYLSGNQLNGSIPIEIGKLTNLTTLSLSANQLSGSIPVEIGKLTSLNNLDLNNNQLIGSVPAELSTLKKLSWLSLSNNQLSGDLNPLFTAGLPALEFLVLSNNKFAGAFPESITNCTKLLILYLDNNVFTSLPLIPPQSYFLNINASNNELKTIPNFATQANKSKLYLDLDNNRLDFSSLEPIVNQGIGSLSIIPQKNINDVQNIEIAVAKGFTIPARNPGLYSTITWEKQLSDGSWASVNTLNEDPTQKTFVKKTYSSSDVGVYRWRMTNTMVTGMELSSEPITVSTPQNMVPDEVEFNALKDLFTSTNGTGWTTKTNWPTTWPTTATSAQFGTWFGVTVTRGDVSAISLNNNNLSGALPTSIGALQMLTTLSLNSNSLSGAIPSQVETLASLASLDLSKNRFAGSIPAGVSSLASLKVLNVASNQLKGSLADLTVLTFSVLDLSNNFLDFTVIEPLVKKGVSFTYLPQGEIIDILKPVGFSRDKPLIITSRKGTPNTTLTWEKKQTDGSWLSIDATNQDPTKATFKKGKPLVEDAGFYRWQMTSSIVTNMQLRSAPIEVISLEKEIDKAISIVPKNTIPEVFKIDSYGRFPTAGYVIAPLFKLNEATVGKSFPVPVPCDGEYYIAFEFAYQVVDEKKTQDLWFRQLDISFYNNNQLLWSGKIQVNTRNQTFVSTGFYPSPVSCNGGANNYSLVVNTINSIGDAPEVSISTNAIEFKKRDPFSEIAAPPSITCQLDAAEASVTVSGYAGLANATEYDIEWVFVDNEDIANVGDSPVVFSKKEPARVTLSNNAFIHKLTYPDGKLWYRVRGAGYSINNPQQRITGAWTNCLAGVTVTNLDVNKNWQVQTVFAEDGKYKKVVQYLDGTTRARQSLTNLSSDNVTLVGETLYDFEGRKSVEVLATPVADANGKLINSLNFKPAVNRFLGQVDNKVKAHFDNGKALNSKLDNSSGAAYYYSANNPLRNSSIINTNNAYIPDAEGYAYSQVEYLNDGTGRIKRQAGVGKEFAMDKQDGDKNNEHTTKHFYGSAASQELVRLFGVDNVGNASHYKKNLVQDANHQVNVTYLDQAGQVVATALAGDKPANVDALASFTEAYNKTENIVVDLSDASKTTIEGNKKIISHKILNATPNTVYNFSYALNTLAADMGSAGCKECKFDLSINITDPDGNSVELPDTYTKAPDGKGYLIQDLTAACSTNLTSNIQFAITLADVGDYTLTKVLTARELTFDQLKAQVLLNPDAAREIQALDQTYVADLTKCDVGQDPNLVTTIIEETASQDCENVLRKIVQNLRDVRSDPAYEPTQQEKEADPAWCQYILCVKNKPSTVFERQMAIVDGWGNAVETYKKANQFNVGVLVDQDPFFINTNATGYGLGPVMKDKLNNLVIDSKQTLRGALDAITDPASTAYWVKADRSGEPSSTSDVHVLYYDLMTTTPVNQRNNEYNTQLGKQRWTLYQSFYLQAKRQLMLERTAYNTCQAAKDDFLSIDNLPQTENDIIDWSKTQNRGNISEAELAIWVDKLIEGCERSFTDIDKNSLKEYLRAYFDNPKAKPSSGAWFNSGYTSNNIFKIILKNDLSPINPNLAAINTILQGKCTKTVTDFAIDDPATCNISSPIKTISTPAQNLVINPQFSVTGPGCPPNSIDCYQGWKAVAGKPIVNKNDQNGNSATISSAAACDINSSAIMGSLKTPLNQGQRYKLVFDYETGEDTPPEGPHDFYFQLTDQPNYRPIAPTTCLVAQASATVKSSSPKPSVQPLQPSNGAYATPTNEIPCSQLPPYLNFTVSPTPSSSGDIITSEPNNNSYTISMSLSACENYDGDRIFTFQLSGSAANDLDYTLSNTQFRIPIGNSSSNTITLSILYDNIVEGDEDIFIAVNTLPGLPGVSPNPLHIIIHDNDSQTINLEVAPTSVTEGGAKASIKAKVGKASNERQSVKVNVTNVSETDYRLSNPIINIPPNSLEGSVDFFAVDDNTVENTEIANIKLETVYASRGFTVDENTQQSVTIQDKPTNTSTCCNRPGVVSLQKEIDLVANGVVFTPNRRNVGTASIEFTASAPSNLFAFSILNGTATIKNVQIIPLSEQSITYCTSYAKDARLPATADIYLDSAKARCIRNITAQNNALKQAAKDKIIQKYVSTLYATYQTNCLNNASETLSYSFKPLEYHYTLYYHDQAGNLVQTVPPAGVKFSNGTTAPQHTLVTSYQYSTLNQLSQESTPDAGTTRHWYNTKSQQRLTQNAQQALENKYAYTKYDDQGRAIEAGEMATPTKPSDSELATLIEDKNSPLASAYTLTDVTKTHYDFANPYPLWGHVQNMTISGNTLARGSENSACHAFAQNGLPAGQNGYIEFKVGSAYTHGLVGLTGDDLINLYAVDYGLLIENGNVFLLENSNAQTVVTSYTYNDLLRIERVGTTISYKKNGITVLVSSVPSSSELFGICDLDGGSVTDVAMGSLPSNGSVSVTQASFVQQNLRSRVSWVEVLDKDATMPTTTQYSYDMHGNVKTVLQQLPGLSPKRTDYLYDLVSGKINFVMYQFGNTDQFVHKYSYDADNRITEVATSTDRYLFNRDARYTYYLHGPLARIELGHHRVQGLDYYYTLQGWLKGVNSPTGTAAQANDPGQDGIGTSLVGRDVFAYNLGYYQGDYKPIGDVANVLVETTSPLLWSGVGGEADIRNLYNGNIAWMATDLAKLGQLNKNRNLGVQAMRYQYDQLHRITASTSLAVFSPATGFAARTNLYDEQYTYDANGNLLTLTRNDDKAAQRDNLQYSYIANTNKLAGLQNATTLTYTGEVRSNERVYANIEVGENAYLKAGADVELRATNAIRFHPNFSKAQGKSMYAHIVGAETLEYRYDAIGNLVADAEQGITISWTPYGKVRQVKAHHDSVTVSYRYDASGNRTEKRVTTLTPLSPGAGAGGEATSTTTTRYVRDASGNVMGIYKNDSLSEVPIYGSARLGQYMGKQKQGEGTMGLRRYELTNHLGNVLTVISDRVGMKQDSVWATVLSASDYYPFGLEMKGRTWTDSTYRYGFNGKETDIETGYTDYGFRLMDRVTGRFITVDPLTKKYPWYTPYQFAGNMPIKYIDLDGLEPAKNPKDPANQDGRNPTETINSIFEQSGGQANYERNFTNYMKGAYDGTATTTGGVSNKTGYTSDSKGGADKGNLWVNNTGIFNATDYQNFSTRDFTNFLLGNMINGTGPENIVFPLNGTVSNYMKGAGIVNDAMASWYSLNQGRSSLVGGKAEFSGNSHNAQSFFGNGMFHPETMVGSATVMITPINDKEVMVKVFNVTSLTSGDFAKHLPWNSYPMSVVRDLSKTSASGANKYGNISQTYQFTLPIDASQLKK